MTSDPEDGEVVRISEDGETTIPAALREELGIDVPGRVLVRRKDDYIVIEPVPSVSG